VIRIIDGVPFQGKASPRYKVKAYDLGNGQVEATASRCIDWEELGWSPSVIRDHEEMMAKYREENAEEIAQRHAARAAQTARKRVRHLCKAMGTDSLITLTYRALMTDLGLCKRHLKEFNRRLKRHLPGFQFVAGFERQKRGAWHVHLATSGIPHFFMEKNSLGVPCKVKSYDLLRRIWLSVVGDLGGAANLSRAKGKRSTCAKIAAYIAKYITKEFAEGEKWSNRWAKFGKCEVPLPVDLGVFGNLLDALQAVYSVLMPGQVVGQSFLPRFQDFYFLSAEPPPA